MFIYLFIYVFIYLLLCLIIYLFSGRELTGVICQWMVHGSKLNFYYDHLCSRVILLLSITWNFECVCFVFLFVLSQYFMVYAPNNKKVLSFKMLIVLTCLLLLPATNFSSIMYLDRLHSLTTHFKLKLLEFFFLSLQEWTDSRFSWDPSSYSNIDTMFLDDTNLWIPKLMIDNS